MFGSDNQAGAHPSVMAAVAAANEGRAGSYGADPWTARARAALATVFETDDFDSYYVATGGAANGLALSLLCPSWGAVVCHAEGHVICDEGTGPELLTGGARLLPVGAPDGKLTPAHLQAAAERHDPAFVHGSQPRAISFTNLSETGQAYSAPETAALCAAAKQRGWGVHLDGARFANAVVATGAAPADLSWRAGVDVLCLGLTKTGAMMAEVVLVFGAARDASSAYRQKRAGQLMSKQRYAGAQVAALLEGGLWLELARHANEVSAKLADVLNNSGIDLAIKPDGNEVFATLSTDQAAKLAEAGVQCYPWPSLGEGVYRFVAGWASSLDDVAFMQRVLKTG
jgi:threonine aldolase